eukprot:399778-Rhodomonas_salina.2
MAVRIMIGTARRPGLFLGAKLQEYPGTETRLYKILPNNPGTNVFYAEGGGMSPVIRNITKPVVALAVRGRTSSGLTEVG